MNARRLVACVAALLVAGSGLAPCVAFQRQGAGGDCHLPAESMSARCECGCIGDLPRSAPGASSALWAVPTPQLREIDPTKAPAPHGGDASASDAELPNTDHVPIVA